MTSRGWTELKYKAELVLPLLIYASAYIYTYILLVHFYNFL